MKKTLFKKVFGFILVVTVLMSQAVIFAESNEPDSTIILKEDINTAQLLHSLGFIKSAELKEEDYTSEVTRSKFVGYVGKMFGMEENNNDTDNYFYDLEEHGSKSIVNRLVGMNVISVNDERLFYPDDAVSREEVLKVFVAALGYNVVAQTSGGYPTGYVLTAKKIGLYTGISDNPALAEIYRVMESALGIPLFDGKVFSADGVEHRTDENVTVLSVYNGIYSDEGYVRSVEDLSVDGSAAGEGRILIGDYIYNLKEYRDLYPENFLGLNVKAYYKEPSRGERILTLMLDTGKSEVIVLNASDAGPLGNDYRLRYYDENDREVYYSIDRGATVVYNGAVVSTNITNVFANLTSGYVRLIEGREGSPYKYVLINDYTNFVVSHTDNAKGILHDKFGSTPINTAQADNLRIYDKEMNLAGFSAVKKNDVLSVARDLNGNVSEILISTDVIEGVISSVSQSGGKTRLNINNVVYNMYPNAGNGEVIKAGLSGKFYLNCFGEIAFFEKSIETGLRYAILCKMKLETKFDTKMTFRVFEQSGKWNNYVVADKVYVDEIIQDTVSEILTALGSTESALEPQVIRFETNADNEIIRIDTEAFKTGYETNRNAMQSTDFGACYIGWWGSTRTLDFKGLTDAETVVFYAPTISNIKAGSYEEAEFSISKVAEIGEYITSLTPVIGYKADSHTVAEDIIVRYGENYAQTWDSSKAKLIVVDSIETAMNENMDVVTVLKCFDGTEQATIEIDGSYESTFMTLGLEKGDAISAGRDEMGRITDVKKLYDRKDGVQGLGWNTPNKLKSDATPPFDCRFAYAGCVEGNMLRCFNDKDGDKNASDLAFFCSGNIVIVEDNNRDTDVYIGTSADIVDAVSSETGFSKVLAHYRSHDKVTVVVYK